MSIPAPQLVQSLFAKFPLYTHPAVQRPRQNNSLSSSPCLWIVPPPPGSSPISTDVNCVKHQAYVVLNGLQTGPEKSRVRLRWDISEDGAIDCLLPNLALPNGEVLGSKAIPAWVHARVKENEKSLEGEEGLDSEWDDGFEDEKTRDEMRAWVEVMEGPVKAALAAYAPPPTLAESLTSWMSPRRAKDDLAVVSPLNKLSTAGLSALYSWNWTSNSPSENTLEEFKEAIRALADRLGNDKWLLGSLKPTSLDAVVFAYLHVLLKAGPEDLRLEVWQYANLVAWEIHVRLLVEKAFKQ
ncbi:hypothetical protein SISSUDRAFT_1060892 [Sistotremastrum suecicum HHB10207 ss-3]|uniref:Metaxin glutathione S-transferase domain-containing protein n=1 Tax=Sistotremastrum suecicum HHB10207 ss-3 TaxID=1314776 RepID=A0A166EK91_9AGAM|nr:hypothetical protein SISSUDRAFT_1060892 [Sistotremastrum suecicum HHB10207 ss-3]